MERLANLVEKFREDHPEIESSVLLDFAQHVCRVMKDELREESKVADRRVRVSLQVHGQAFSADGPCSYVESLLAEWQGWAETPPRKNVTPGFNRMKLISGPSR